MAYWEQVVREGILDNLAKSKLAPYAGEMLLGLSGVGSLAKLAYGLYDIYKVNKAEKTELEKQNILRMQAEKARTERLALMRERNYARHAAYAQQTEYGVSAMTHAAVSSGLSIYSGEAQHNKQQFLKNRARMEYLVLLGEA